MNGFIYVVQQGNDYRFKIGRTVNLLRRMKALQTMSPQALHLIGFYPTADDLSGHELFWHRRFGLDRRHGEWFDLPLEALQDLARHCLVWGKSYEDRVPLDDWTGDDGKDYYVSPVPGMLLRVTVDDRDDANVVYVSGVDENWNVKCSDTEVCVDPRDAILCPVGFGEYANEERQRAYLLHQQCCRAMRV